MDFLIKYAARNWDHLAGLEKIKRNLIRACGQNQLPLGMIFSGPFGSGKTVAARLVRIHSQCGSRSEIHPYTCSQCQCSDELRFDRSRYSCPEWSGDRHRYSFLRMNCTEAGFTSGLSLLTDCEFYKPGVVLFDEFHHVRRDLQEKLLIPLEDIKTKKRIILATTELDRVLPGIRSRCQPFPFEYPSTAEMATFLKRVAGQEGIETEDETVLSVIADALGCRPRECLKFLERYLLEFGGIVKEADVRKLLEVVMGESIGTREDDDWEGLLS